MDEFKKEVETSNYEDVKSMQNAIVENSSQFVKLGLAKLKGSDRKVTEERKRLIEEIKSNGVAMCESCGQEVYTVSTDAVDSSLSTRSEATRIKKEAKEGTVCKCCGNRAYVKTHRLDGRLALALVEIMKFFRHHPEAKETGYYTKKDFFGHHEKEFQELFEGFEQLYLWDLICRMPTSPKEVIYKDGYYGMTEVGTLFFQRTKSVPRTVYSYNGEVEGYLTGKDAGDHQGFVSIEDLLEEVGVDYNEYVKID